MKKVLITMLMSTILFAEEPPAYLKDGTITVTLKNGQTYSFSSNEWKVVPRRDENSPEPVQRVVTEVVHKETPPNRLTLHGGVGYSGFHVQSGPGTLEITEKLMPVVGLTYSRNIGDNFSLSGTVLSNKTFLLGGGYDF